MKQIRWGLFPFLGAPALVLCALYISVQYSQNQARSFYEVYVTWVGLGAYVFCAILGQFSYPRVHNSKIYYLGYLTGILGLGYFLYLNGFFPFHKTELHREFINVLYLLILTNLVLANIIPSTLKYRWTKRLTWGTAALQAAWLLASTHFPGALSLFEGMRGPSFSLWADIWGGSAFILILFFSFIFVRQDFYLGGAITGLGLIMAVAWHAPHFWQEAASLELILLAVLPLYTIACIFIHWLWRMEHRVSHDPLLQIYNRSYCNKIISEQSSVDTRPPFSVAMVDIDHFKKVNDTHGHKAGDEVLYAIAQLIAEEIHDAGIVCRYGGEELIVFFPQMGAQEATDIMDEVRVSIESNQVKSGRKTIQVTISSGVSCRDKSSQSVKGIIETADKALYKAKKGGRNAVKTQKIPIRRK